MSVAHRKERELGAALQFAEGPIQLVGRRPGDLFLGSRTVSQNPAQTVDQPHAGVGMDCPEQCHRGPMPGNLVQQLPGPVTFGDPVAMNHCGRLSRQLKTPFHRGELDSQVVGPELPAPAVVVSPDHEDRRPPAERRQPGHHRQIPAGYRAMVAEPEFEQVAGDNEPVTQIGDGVQEGQKRSFGFRGPAAKVGITHEHEALAVHRAKIGLGEELREGRTRRAGRPRRAPFPAITLSSPLVPWPSPSRPSRLFSSPDPVHRAPEETVTTHRVNYSETDQMGVVYHARHVVWLDIARTEHLRQAGYSYRELEEEGVRLVVTDLQVRYIGAARYDDLVEIRCRVKEAKSRRVIFTYRLETGGHHIADAETTLMCLDRNHRLSRLPHSVVAALEPHSAPSS